VLGLNPWKSRAKVLESKRAALAGTSAERHAFPAMEAGQFLEEGVVKWFIHDRTKEALSIGEDAPAGGVMRNAFGTSILVAYPDPAIRLAASPDALVVYGDGMRHLVEVKLLGPGSHDGEVPGSWQKWTHPARSRAWAAMGREPALGCPVPHYVQLQVQLLCTGERFGWVVGCCGTKRTDHPFGRDADLHERIIKATEEFWQECDNG
jgi:hypothetical protein